MLTPEEIQAREFTLARRGYDRADVRNFLARVSADLERLHQRVRQLEGDLAAERDAMAQLKARPPAEPAEPQPPRDQVAEASAMFAEISQETQRILEAAQEAGSQIVRKAKQEADREQHAARVQAAKLIAEGERRREAIERALEGVDASRAGLVDELRAVGRTVERLLRDLDPRAETSSTMREALAAEAAAGAKSDEPSRSGTITAGKPEPSGPAPLAVLQQPERGAAEGVAELTLDEAEAEPAAGDTSNEDDEAATEAAGRELMLDEPAPQPAVEEAEPASADLGEPEPAVEESVLASADLDEPEPELEPAVAEPEHVEPAVADAEPAPAVEQPAAASDPESAVEQPAQHAGDGADVIPLKPARGGMIIDGDHLAPQALRAAALNHLQPKLVRGIKRGMHDLHNLMLDRLRRAGGRGEPEEFLPTEDELRSLAGLVDELLEQAYEAGSIAASRLVDRRLPRPSADRGLGTDFVGDASGRVLRSLLATLRMGLSSDEELEALTNRVRSTFGELKTATAEQLAVTHLIHAYELGMLDSWAAGGITHRRWVLGKEPRCPEGRCRHNDQTGALALGEPFPSGHDAPPVHVGCTCTTVPISEPA